MPEKLAFAKSYILVKIKGKGKRKKVKGKR